MQPHSAGLTLNDNNSTQTQRQKSDAYRHQWHAPLILFVFKMSVNGLLLLAHHLVEVVKTYALLVKFDNALKHSVSLRSMLRSTRESTYSFFFSMSAA